jgi:two-component sensor histidine kinase
MLQPNAVQYLGIAFHELATNSAKHGALSCSSGGIKIEWNVIAATDGADIFRLVWRELEGPIPDSTRGRGFGSVVLTHVAPRALSGSGRLDFHEQGVTWTLEAPLNSVQVSPAGVMAD